MKKAPVVLSILYIFLVGIYTLQQAIIGNPFQDDVPPLFLFILYLLMGAGALFYALRKNNQD